MKRQDLVTLPFFMTYSMSLLCVGQQTPVFAFRHQKSNSKSQINSKTQSRIPKTCLFFDILIIAIYLVFDICDLDFLLLPLTRYY